MFSAPLRRQSLMTFWMLLIALGLFAPAQAASSEYEPRPYQEGKDVVWVPTAQALANKMLNLANVTPQDYVIDLGSGDGRIVITAAKRGARALGVEYEPELVALSKKNALREGVADKARFIQGDLFETDFSQATVITMFLLPEINLKLRPAILNLKPGTRVVSNSFTMGDWKADHTIVVDPAEGCDNNFCEAYLWIVPAKVEGIWKLSQGELRLKQSFQMISGTLKSGAKTKPITHSQLHGDQISFLVEDEQYTGRVSGDAIEGIVRTGGKTTNWTATRTGKAKAK